MLDAQEWDEQVAREGRHQARIETAFDRAEGCERFGDFGQALGWLDTADRLSGGLPQAYLALRFRWARELAGG